MEVKKAILVGSLVVNVPVFAIMIATPFLLALTNLPWLTLPGFFLGFVLAWLYWSVAITKWKKWAYPRVVDVAELRKAAIRAYLIWPSDSVFNKTEFKTETEEQQEKQFESDARINPKIERTQVPVILRRARLLLRVILWGIILPVLLLLFVAYTSEFYEVGIQGHTEGYPWGWPGAWNYKDPHTYSLSVLAGVILTASAFVLALVIDRKFLRGL